MLQKGNNSNGATNNSNGAISEAELLRLAASVEKGSEHPLGEAIVAEAGNRELLLSDPQSFQAAVGHGVSAQVDGRLVQVGNLRMAAAQDIPLDGLSGEVERLQGEAKTVMVVSIDGQVRGLIAEADTVKEGSLEAIRKLHEMGLKVVMITGDNRQTAQAIARQVGVDTVLAEVLPGDKAAEVTGSRPAARWFPWSGTASTMRPPWPSPMLALPSVPAQTLPWPPPRWC